MSHYPYQPSVPKTLIQFLIRSVAETDQLGGETSKILRSILTTEFSPELVPVGLDEEQPTQRSEDTIGPYEIQDFILYLAIRFGYLPLRIAFLSYCSWKDRNRGRWPDIPAERRNQYTLADIKHWLSVFAWRFFQLSQFKRSCIPNAPESSVPAVLYLRAAIIVHPATAKQPPG